MGTFLTQRSGFPLMVTAAAVLIISAVTVLLVYDPFDWRGDETSQVGRVEAEAADAGKDAAGGEPADTTEPVEAAEPVGVAEPMDAAEPAPSSAPLPAEGRDSNGAEPEPIDTYIVRTKDTLFDIAGDIWGDPYAWPLLLLANRTTVNDPDFLAPGQSIQVPEWSGPPLTPGEIETVSSAHLLAYQRYRELGLQSATSAQRRLGPVRINKSLWVLYSGLRYDHALLDSLPDMIRAEDAATIGAFVARFGYPPDPPDPE